jgi:hypothetical protein
MGLDVVGVAAPYPPRQKLMDLLAGGVAYQPVIDVALLARRQCQSPRVQISEEG